LFKGSHHKRFKKKKEVRKKERKKEKKKKTEFRGVPRSGSQYNQVPG